MIWIAPVMRTKAFLVSLLAIIVHLAMPVMPRAASSVPADLVCLETRRSVEGGSYLPRASTAEGLCRPSIGDDAGEPSPRRASRQRPSSFLVPPPRRELVAHRRSYPARSSLAHRLAHPDDDQPA